MYIYSLLDNIFHNINILTSFSLHLEFKSNELFINIGTLKIIYI